MSPLSKDPESWLEQADYDFQVAVSNFNNDHRFYAVFFCHLAVEKALKGLYFKRLGVIPPRTHSHFYFLKKLEIVPPDEIFEFLSELDGAHVATRYADEFKMLQQRFSPETVKDILKNSKETIEWIKILFWE